MYTVLKQVREDGWPGYERGDWRTVGRHEQYSDALNHMDAVVTDPTDRVIVWNENKVTMAAAFENTRRWKSFPGLSHERENFYF